LGCSGGVRKFDIKAVLYISLSQRPFVSLLIFNIPSPFMPAINLSIFEAIFNQIPVPTIILEANAPDFTIIAENRQHKRLTSTRTEPLAGKPAAGVFADEVLMAGLRQCVSECIPVTLPPFRYAAVPADSENRRALWLRAELAPILEDSGRVAYLHCQFFEAQEQTQEIAFTTALEDLKSRMENRDQELLRSQHSMRTLIMNSHFSLSILRGPEMVVEIANQEQAKLWNKGLEEITGRRIMDILPELEGQRFPQLLAEVYRTGVPYGQEEEVFLLDTPQGRVKKYVSFYYDPMLDENGSVEGIIISSDDVTKQVANRLLLQQSYEKQQSLNQELATANAQLGVSESKFRSMISQAPVAIGVLRGRELIIETANAKLMEIWGHKTGVINMPLAEALPEISDQPFLKILDDVITTGTPYYKYEIPVMLDHGGVLKKIYLDLLYHPLKNESGTTESILVIASDLTEQVISRQKASRAETLLRLAVEAGNIGSWHIDPNTKALEYDVVLARIFGYEGEARMTYGQAIGQVTEEHRARIVQDIEQAIENGEDYDITYAQRRFNDGSLIWLRSLGKVAAGLEGSGPVFSGIVMDVTEQKLDEQRKNDFIGMVSHELKTPLTSLSGFLQLLQRKALTAGDAFTARSMDRSLNQVRKMTTMINGFLNISKLESGKIDLNKKWFSLSELIQEMLEDAMAIQSTHQMSYTGCQVSVYADRDKIGNVISNLLSNAVKYAPGGKRVEVDCQLNDNSVQVSIKDEGMGIAPEHLDRLFQRFYRVQPNNDNISGFGIGLYLSAEIIRRHNGKIWAESVPGEGSVFHFTLPRTS
jgi:PAS domain S-box-containing protein